MTINDHATTFAGKPIIDYDPKNGLLEADKFHFKIGFGYDAFDASEPLTTVIEEFVNEPEVGHVTGIVIGAWEDIGMENSNASIVDALAAAREKLPNLKGIFMADVTFEESEISWIQQSDMSAIFKAYPELTHFRVRGGQGLGLGDLNHSHLESLVVETGGLDRSIVQQVVSAQLPELEHLELWLGTEDYGGSTSLKDIEPLLYNNPFPKLAYLGLRDSERCDAIVSEIVNAPILDQIKTLDLSLGTLTDEGGQALLDCPAITQLAKLDLHYHFLSDEMMAQLQSKGDHIDLSDQQEQDDDYRYPAVTE